VHQQAISQDTSCAGSSMWIFDNYNNTQGTFPNNHEICFFRTGSTTGCIDFKNYNRYCQSMLGHMSCTSWGSNGTYPSGVHSFWAGNSGGYFMNEGWDAGIGTDQAYVFSAWQRVDNTDSLEQVAYAGALCM
jgi:hypothetical protein